MAESSSLQLFFSFTVDETNKLMSGFIRTKDCHYKNYCLSRFNVQCPRA